MKFMQRSGKSSFMYRGKIRAGKCTKDLIPRLQPGNIALISHSDLDELAADSLLASRVKVIINAERFASGAFANFAPRRLLQAGVHLVEGVEHSIFDVVEDGEQVRVEGDCVLRGGQVVARGLVFSERIWEQRMGLAREQALSVAENFFDNTLNYASREKELLLGQPEAPILKTTLQGKDVVIVVRGRNYRDDLSIIRHYLKEARPVLIGVDGGADALWEAGFTPHIVVGDMDSVSDLVLQRAGEIVVHAYPDGRGAPGLKRVQNLNLDYRLFTVPGTSEDIALLLAYDKGAELIVALGTHFGVTEFLEKGRRGMSSTLLVRLKVADRLVDAKGVSRLYKRSAPSSILSIIFLAGLFPVIILLFLSPLVQHFFYVLLWRISLGP